MRCFYLVRLLGDYVILVLKIDKPYVYKMNPVFYYTCIITDKIINGTTRSIRSGKLCNESNKGKNGTNISRQLEENSPRVSIADMKLEMK